MRTHRAVLPVALTGLVLAFGGSLAGFGLASAGTGAPETDAPAIEQGREGRMRAAGEGHAAGGDRPDCPAGAAARFADA